MKKIYVEQIRERDWVDSPFLVRDKIMAMAKNGKPYMTLKLVDRSGEVEGRVWDRVDEFSALFDKDDFIRIQGKASVYLGKMQLVVQDLEAVPEERIDLADFLPVSVRPIEEMEEELRAKVASLSDPWLRKLMEAFVSDAPFLQRFSRAPAAKTMHHVYLGGLLEHSLAVSDLVEDVCRRYPSLNRDLLMVGALLHDVGKVAELSYERTFDYTDEGKLLGHIVMGVEMVEDKIRQIPGFPAQVKILIKHQLLSHHGQYDYGSPKRPKTLEAVVLNFLDDLDSKINGVRTHIEKEPDSPSNWTSYHRLYDRYFYKGEREPRVEVAPPVSPQEPQAPQGPPMRVSPPAAVPEPPPKKGNSEGPSAARRDRAENSRKGFGFTLGDQLRGKSLDLFSADDE